MATKKTTAKKKTTASLPVKKQTILKKKAVKLPPPVKKSSVAGKSPAKKTGHIEITTQKVNTKKQHSPRIPVKKTVPAKTKKAPAVSKKKILLGTASSAMDSFKKTLNAVHKKGMAKLSPGDRKMLKKELQLLRDRVMGEIEFLTDDSLNKSMKDTAGDMTMHGMHMADHGTDNFDREFALNLVSAEHDVLYEIDDALRRIDDATYGICEGCGCQVEKARLEALPFARLCIHCKSEKEKGAVKYRPLGPTLSTRT